MPDALRRRAHQFLRTARHAHHEDLEAAYENARLATELAAKSLLSRAGVPNEKDHNVAPSLVRNEIIPADANARSLSKFLQDHTRGRYGMDEPVDPKDLEQAMRLAEWMVGLCDDAAAPPQP